MKPYTIGLDIGTNSIGWAVVDLQNGKLLDAGVRLFEAGLQNLGEGEKEQSKNVDRRIFRGMRRQKFRRQLRKQKMTKWLKNIGWWTDITDQQIRLSDPYALRSSALDQQLETWELARVLYHLAQRRGFKSNRKFNTKGEEGALKKGSDSIVGFETTQIEWQNSGKSTLGAFLASLSKEERKRSRYTQRKWYTDEFNLIWDKQQTYYPEIMTSDAKEHVYHILFYQRPLKDVSHLIGKCRFEVEEKRAPASHPLTQRFRVAQNLSNLKITCLETGEIRTLTPDEREYLSSILHEGDAKISLKDLPKKLHEWNNAHLPKKERKPFDASQVKINLDDQKALKGRSTEAQLKKVFSSQFDQLSEAHIVELWELLYKTESPEAVFKTGKEQWNLSDAQAKALSEIHLEEKYSSLSLKAIEKILPFIEKEHLLYHQAMEKAGYNHALPDDKDRVLLPKLEPCNYDDIRNPVVYTALTEVRRVINCIIHRYGKPDVIRIEVARDLKQNSDQRFEENKKMKDRGLANDRIYKKCEELGAKSPKRSDILKYQLWEECKGICIYSGRKIAATDLFADNSGLINIDHIIPISRSMRDDRTNKVLVYQDKNAEKGDRTPFEWLGEGKQFDEIVNRAKEFLDTEKQKLIGLKETGESLDGFVQSQLNDTRYVSRETVKYLKAICYNVEAVKAGFVAILRNEWGLERGEDKKGTFLSNPYLDNLELHKDELKKGKSRLDHRHHAIDAIVIACANVKRIAQINRERQKESSGKGIQRKSVFRPPWDNFRSDVCQFTDNIFISYKTRRKVSGALHKETIYGVNLDPNGQVIKNSKTGNTRYVVRKPLLSLSKKEIENIVDDELRNYIQAEMKTYAQEHELDITKEKDFEKIKKDVFTKDFRHPTGHTAMKKIRVYVDQQENIKVRELSHRTQKHAYAQSERTHHTAIYRMPDGKLEADMVSLWKATKRKRFNDPLYAPTFESSGELITTFVNKELLFLTKDLDAQKVRELLAQFAPKDKNTYHVLFRYIYRWDTTQSNTKQMFFIHHSIAKKDVKTVQEKKTVGNASAYPSTLKGLKLIVDPLGYVTEIIEIKL